MLALGVIRARRRDTLCAVMLKHYFYVVFMENVATIYENSQVRILSLLILVISLIKLNWVCVLSLLILTINY